MLNIFTDPMILEGRRNLLEISGGDDGRDDDYGGENAGYVNVDCDEE